MLVRSRAEAAQAIGQFGAIATPYILEVLDDAEPPQALLASPKRGIDRR